MVHYFSRFIFGQVNNCRGLKEVKITEQVKVSHSALMC